MYKYVLLFLSALRLPPACPEPSCFCVCMYVGGRHLSGSRRPSKTCPDSRSGSNVTALDLPRASGAWPFPPPSRAGARRLFALLEHSLTNGTASGVSAPHRPALCLLFFNFFPPPHHDSFYATQIAQAPASATADGIKRVYLLPEGNKDMKV